MKLMEKMRELLNRPSHAPETAGPGITDTPTRAGRHERGAEQAAGTGHGDGVREPGGERG